MESSSFITCTVCGRHVPSANMALHQARGCTLARREQQEASDSDDGVLVEPPEEEIQVETVEESENAPEEVLGTAESPIDLFSPSQRQGISSYPSANASASRHDSRDTSWTCAVCTLSNAAADSRCQACETPRGQTSYQPRAPPPSQAPSAPREPRPPAATRQNPTVPLHHRFSQTTTTAAAGAALGMALTLAGAIWSGRPASTPRILQGAVTGAVGATLWREVVVATNDEYDNALLRAYLSQLDPHQRYVNIDNMSYEELLQRFGDGSSRHRGATREQLDRLTVRKVEESRQAETCSICLANFEQDQDEVELPCGHVFHRPCATAWLQTNASCPLCKRQLE